MVTLREFVDDLCASDDVPEKSKVRIQEILNDIFGSEDESIGAYFISEGKPYGAVPIVASAIIYNAGTLLEFQAHENGDIYHDFITVNSVFNIKHETTFSKSSPEEDQVSFYRVRFIHAESGQIWTAMGARTRDKISQLKIFVHFIASKAGLRISA